MNIPKKLKHIWIGPKPAPTKWMNTWKKKHPDWEYSVFTQSDFENRTFRNQAHIDTYMSRGIYAGVADMIRYELLHEEGGLIVPADAVCLNNTDELWNQPKDYCYSVYESERFAPKYISPIYACNPSNTFINTIIEEIRSTPKLDSRPWVGTGNAFLAKMLEKHNPNIKIFPSHYFIPSHFRNPDIRYDGPDKVYAEQYWGSTHKNKDVYSEGV